MRRIYANKLLECQIVVFTVEDEKKRQSLGGAFASIVVSELL